MWGLIRCDPVNLNKIQDDIFKKNIKTKAYLIDPGQLRLINLSNIQPKLWDRDNPIENKSKPNTKLNSQLN